MKYPQHTLTANNGQVTVRRGDVEIYSFKADLVEEMSIEPRRLAGQDTPCAVLILRGAGPGGILFATHELAAEAMRVVDQARRRTMRVFDFNACDKHIRKGNGLHPPCVYEAKDYDVELLALGAKVGEQVVLVYGDTA